MMISELPEELLEEILSRVPAKSLKWLPSTCKRWNRLFNDERFTRKQFDKAAKQFVTLMFKEFGFYSMRINLHRSSPEKLIGELINLTELQSSLDQTDIYLVSYCDGLLLCLTNTGLVIWNPCTGQTRWILDRHEWYTKYALGSYQDKSSNDISYKILSQRGYGRNQEFRIYEIISNSWRILDVTVDLKFLGHLKWSVSLKGKTYWIARDGKEGYGDKFLLVSFDYTTERFERLCLPPQYPSFQNLALSVVREEKLSVLLQRKFASKTEVWVTNKISETKGVTWSMVLAVDLGPECHILTGASFWFDEEKRVLVCCNNLVYNAETEVHIVGEDNKVEQVDVALRPSMPFLLNYDPSLTLI